MDTIQTVAGAFTPYDFEAISVTGVAVGFTAAKVTPTSTEKDRNFGHARYIMVTVETNTIRYTLDGTAPAAGTTGHLATAGASLSFTNYQTMKNFRAVKEGGGNGTLQVTYLR